MSKKRTIFLVRWWRQLLNLLSCRDVKLESERREEIYRLSYWLGCMQNESSQLRYKQLNENAARCMLRIEELDNILGGERSAR